MQANKAPNTRHDKNVFFYLLPRGTYFPCKYVTTTPLKNNTNSMISKATLDTLVLAANTSTNAVLYCRCNLMTANIINRCLL